MEEEKRRKRFKDEKEETITSIDLDIKDPTFSFVNDTFQYDQTDHKLFEKQGYYTYPDFLTKEAIHLLRNEYDEIIKSKHDSVHNEWVLSLHQFLPESNWMWKLATDPKLLNCLSYHLGKHLVLYSTQLAYKPPHCGRMVPWHQDGENCRTVWIPLDEITKENGGLSVQPGWHKKGRLPFKHVTSEEDYENCLFNLKYSVFALNHNMDPKVFDATSLDYSFPAGTFEIHHPSLPHRSCPNNTASPRRVIIMRYQPAVEKIYRNSILHWRTGIELKKDNYIVKGCFGIQRAKPTSRSACVLPDLPSDNKRNSRTTKKANEKGVMKAKQ